MTHPENLIEVETVCASYHIDASFIRTLHQIGLVEVLTIDDVLFVKHKQLPSLERYIDFHYTLDINPEGIETISHLLKHIAELQEEITLLRNRLQFYEPEL